MNLVRRAAAAETVFALFQPHGHILQRSCCAIRTNSGGGACKTQASWDQWASLLWSPIPDNIGHLFWGDTTTTKWGGKHPSAHLFGARKQICPPTQNSSCLNETTEETQLTCFHGLHLWTQQPVCRWEEEEFLKCEILHLSFPILLIVCGACSHWVSMATVL